MTGFKLEDDNPIAVNCELLDWMDKAVPDNQLALICPLGNGDVFGGIVSSTCVQ